MLIFLTLKYRTGAKATIPEMAEACAISRNHLLKIVLELSQCGVPPGSIPAFLGSGSRPRK